MAVRRNSATVRVRVGFTGTRQGMTRGQERALRDLLASYQGATVHHGDCVGAGAQAHHIAANRRTRPGSQSSLFLGSGSQQITACTPYGPVRLC